MRFSRYQFFAAVLVALSLGCAAVSAQEPVEGPVPTTALINVSSKDGAPLNPAMLMLQVNGHETPITSVKPVNQGPSQVAILIDDGLRGNFSLQLTDMSKFVLGLPPSTAVLIGYMRNGDVMSATKGFTTDHSAAVDALRMPIAEPGISASPYFCLSEFVKHWPSNQPGPRFVLMITNGVDPYNGSTSMLNQDSPYVQQAQEDAERAGVAVYSIYYSNAGYRFGRGSFSGQSYLQQVAEATGAESFWQGTGSPVSLEPFLKDFAKSMAESYTVRFMADSAREKNDTLARIKVKTSQRGVKVHAPENVHPGVDLE
jgi:hypothetical protein